MTDRPPPLPTPAEWAALCAAADQRPRGGRLSVVGLLARIRQLETALYETLTRWTELTEYAPHPIVLMQVSKGEASRILAALTPSPGADGVEED